MIPSPSAVQQWLFSHSKETKIQDWLHYAKRFDVPVPFKTGDDNKAIYELPERKLQKYRIEHLLGQFTEATSHYLRIRHLEVEPSPPDLMRLNAAASEDAFYWTALCKFELGEFNTAVDLFSDYLQKYDRKGGWYFPARSMLAMTYAELGQIDKAVSM